MLRRKQSKAYRFVAAFLALLMLASLIPVSHAGLVQAADILESYTVTLTDGSQDGEGNYIPLMQEGVEVTLTDPAQQEAEPISASTDANGVATFANCVEDGKTYQLSVAQVNGYEAFTPMDVTPALDNINYHAVLTPAQPGPAVTTISGTVYGPEGAVYPGASVALYQGIAESAEDELTLLRTTQSDENGQYSFPDVEQNGDYTVTATPVGEGSERLAPASATVSNPSAEGVTSQLHFTVKQFSIDATVGENGSLAVNQDTDGSYTVEYGQDAVIQVEAAAGYRIGTLMVDDETVIAQAAGQQNYTYTIFDVTAAHKVSVTFLRQTYTITFSVDENGKVEYANGIEAVDGGSVSFDESTDPLNPTQVEITAKADENYRISGVTINDTPVDGFDAGNVSEYSTTLILDQNQGNQGNYIVAVTFALNKYQISVADEAKDYISVSQNEAEHGSDMTATITPPEGKTISAFTVNGEQVDLSRLSLVEGNRYEIQYSQTVTGDVVFNADFGDISELQGNYQDYVSISQPLQQIGDQYIYSNNTQSVILKAAENYKGIAVNGSYSVGTSGWSTDASVEVETIWVLDGVVLKQVTMESPIQIIIDQGKPEVTDVQTTADSWTNQAVTVTVTAADEGNFASGVARVVYNTEQTVEGAQEAQQNQDGTYFFTLDSEQNATYYIYAVDRSGNVSDAAQTVVQIDKTDPQITGFSFSSQEDVAVSAGINFKEFGIYSANPIYVTVTAGNDASGVASITLYKGGANETLNAVNGSATFELNADEFAGGAEITAIATDVAGNAVNESESKGPADTGSAQSNFVQINSTAPTVTIDTDEPGYTAETGEKWYGEDTEFTVRISDENVGIQDVKILLNKQDITSLIVTEDFAAQEVSPVDYIIDTSVIQQVAQPPEDGKYTLEVTATNNAGVPNGETPATDTVYLDVEGPDIMDITVENHPRSTWEEVVNFLSFGMFFKDEVDVTVTVSDPAPSVGFGAATLTATVDGEEFASNDDAPEAVVNEDGEATGQYTYTFTLPAPKEGNAEVFYENVTVVVYDLVDHNVSTSVGMKSAANNIMIEAENPVISTSLPSADASVETENETQAWYQDDIEIGVSITDENSGLHYVQILDENNQSNVLVEETLSKTTETETKKTSWETTIDTSEATWNEEDGSYRLVVIATDNAGNQSSDSIVVYKDRSAPEFETVTINPVEQSTGEKIINFLTFGNFCKEQVQITVGVREETPSAGMDEATLTAVVDNGKEQTWSDSEADVSETEGGYLYTYVFTLPEEVMEADSVTTFNGLTLQVMDLVGKSESKVISEISNEQNIANNDLMIETVAPTVSIRANQDPVAAELQNPNTMHADQAWYSHDITFDVTVKDNNSNSDPFSGLNNVSATVNRNEYELTEESDLELPGTESVAETNYTIDTSVAVRDDSTGEYTVRVTAYDNAGNFGGDSAVVYKDTDAPYIYSITFTPITDNSDGALNNTPVQTEYGYYFTTDTQVTIQALDDNGPSSGINTITYYLDDVEDDSEPTYVEEQVASNGTITFTVPANFKGQIYAKATDNVGNTPAEGGADQEGYITPDGVILETQDKHNQENHITFTKEDTSYRDANGLELYGSDVPVNIAIADTYSGIRRVEWSVTAPYDTANNQSGEVNVENNGGLTAEGWQITDQEDNLVTAINTTINVSSDSNGIVLSVTMTDRAGNTSTQSIQFSVDKTAPVIDVVYDNNSPDATYTDIYQADRTATITVTERNFNAADIQMAITNTDGVIPTLTGWEEHWNAADPNASYYVARVSYTADGDYTFDIGYTDRAGHAAAAVSQHRFTIDKTIPTLSVSYNNNNVINGNYYNAQRTATITIVEHNFDPTRVTVVGTATDNGAASVFPALSGWTTQGDTHTATLRYAADGLYTFDIEFNDMAGNAIADFAPQTFYVDQTAPTLEITGVGNQSANNGTVAPVITFFDTNFNPDAVSISLSGINNGTVNYAGAYEEIANGRRFTYADFEHTKQVDDIYTLTVSLTDRAGNVTTQTITFSANRFGSTYDLTDLADLSGKFVQTEEDVIFEEINVDALNHDTIRIVMTKNGTPVDLVEGTDYTVEVTGGNGQWSVYRYIINRSLFADDGRYTISVYSVDSAGNINENIDEAKQAEISFGVDKTAPVIVPLDLDNGAQYPVQVKDTTVEIRDNLVLENVTIYLNDQAVEYQENEESYQFSIPETNSLQDVRIVAEDAAGNQQEVTVADFLVSTNFFVRWYNNTPLFIGTIAGVVVIALGITAFLVFGRRKKKDEGQEEG